MPNVEERQALEAFITSPELSELETRFARFNVFEALGVARRELQHSNFLAFLLDPTESHGLRDLFIRRFLQDAVQVAVLPTPLSAIDIDDLDFSQIEVHREYKNIDILVQDKKNNLVVVIENKVDSKQHSDQLRRYFEIASKDYPDRRFIGIYLTKTGEDSKDEHFIASSYERILSLIRELLNRESVLIPVTFRRVLEQYADLLGKRFMADQELTELCARIYRRHKQALDILRDNVPDEFGRALLVVRDLAIAAKLTIIQEDNNAVRFVPDAFKIPAFESSNAWIPSGQMVFLECKKKGDALVFQAKMDGGIATERAIVHKFANAHKPPFESEKTLYAKYQVLYSQIALDGSIFEMDDDALADRLQNTWSVFLKAISAMSKACSEYEWPLSATIINDMSGAPPLADV